MPRVPARPKPGAGPRRHRLLCLPGLRSEPAAGRGRGDAAEVPAGRLGQAEDGAQEDLLGAQAVGYSYIKIYIGHQIQCPSLNMTLFGTYLITTAFQSPKRLP